MVLPRCLVASRILSHTYRWARWTCTSHHCLYYQSAALTHHVQLQQWPLVVTTTYRRRRDWVSAAVQQTFPSSGAIDGPMCYLPQPLLSPCYQRLHCITTHRGITTSSYMSKQMLKRDENLTDLKSKTDDDKQQYCNQCKDDYVGHSNKYTKSTVRDMKNVSKSTDTPVLPEKTSSDASKEVNGNDLVSEKLPSRVQTYFLWRYSWYLRKFHESLKNEMPDTFKMFSIFTVGLKEFMFDFKELVKILVQLSLPGFSLYSLSRRELEVYYHMPSDMVRVFPILLLSSLPFGQNVAFPIGYWFPRHLLCHHFWDIQQRHEFALMGLKRRLFNARPVFRSLQAALLTLEEEEKRKCRRVFSKLGSGIHPTTDEIIALVPLFQGNPFEISRIGSSHMNGLLRFHGRSVLVRRRRRLRDHARVLHCMDTAISREGIDSLTHDNLKACLIFRGLNPTNMRVAAMVEYLENWLKVSREVDDSCYSLLLHLPIFLAYNQPTNFILIYS